MLLSLRKNSLTSLFKEVMVFKERKMVLWGVLQECLREVIGRHLRGVFCDPIPHSSQRSPGALSEALSETPKLLRTSQLVLLALIWIWHHLRDALGSFSLSRFAKVVNDCRRWLSSKCDVKFVWQYGCRCRGTERQFTGNQMQISPFLLPPFESARHIHIQAKFLG